MDIEAVRATTPSEWERQLSDFMMWGERITGAILVFCVVLDIFLTVLYAKIGMDGISRFGTGIISSGTARLTWRLFRRFSGMSRSRNDGVLSLCGAVTVLLLIAVWAILLTLGVALIIHPALGVGVRSNSSPDATDFFSAIYAAGSSLSVISSSDYSPQSHGFRLFYLFVALIGTSAISLTLTYILQLYSALNQRNSFGLSIHLLTRGTNDAAVLLAGLGPGGRFDIGCSSLGDAAVEMTQLYEAHHIYPLLFFYRPLCIYNAVPQMIFVALDTVTILRTALADDENKWLKESASVEHLWGAALMLAQLLDRSFVPGPGLKPEKMEMDDEKRKSWNRRYEAAVRHLNQSGIHTTVKDGGGAEAYARIRMCWEPYIERIGNYMAYEMPEIDAAGRNTSSRSFTNPKM